VDVIKIINKFYNENSEVYRILLNHGRSVADKALSIARSHPEMNLDRIFLEEAALLHDIGIVFCRAPALDCHGTHDYICHGYLGAELLRQEGLLQHALVCERHTGTGITQAMIEAKQLPLPRLDFVPVTLEEQVICFSDKFFSKTNVGKEKSISQIVDSLRKHGEENVLRFDHWCKRFLE